MCCAVLKQTAAAADDRQPSSFHARSACCSSAPDVQERLNATTSVTPPAGMRSSASTSAWPAEGATLHTRRPDVVAGSCSVSVACTCVAPRALGGCPRCWKGVRRRAKGTALPRPAGGMQAGLEGPRHGRRQARATCPSNIAHHEGALKLLGGSQGATPSCSDLLQLCKAGPSGRRQPSPPADLLPPQPRRGAGPVRSSWHRRSHTGSRRASPRFRLPARQRARPEALKYAPPGPCEIIQPTCNA